MTKDIKLFYVGGYVRDRIMGNVKFKDIELAADAPTFEALREYVESVGEVFNEIPEFYTIRAKVGKKDVFDFVWARKDGPYTDGRHPDYVEPGTLEDDLARRDFTMNAIALAVNPDDGDGYIDPFDGIGDINRHLIRAVGDPYVRIEEDALRIMRALRFSVTTGFRIDDELRHAMLTIKNLHTLQEKISVDRIRDELMKMFKHDSYASMQLLTGQYSPIGGIIQQRGIWFKPTTEGK